VTAKSLSDLGKQQKNPLWRKNCFFTIVEVLSETDDGVMSSVVHVATTSQGGNGCFCNLCLSLSPGHSGSMLLNLSQSKVTLRPSGSYLAGHRFKPHSVSDILFPKSLRCRGGTIAGECHHAEKHIHDFEEIRDVADKLLADASIDFLFIHLPVPHPEPRNIRGIDRRGLPRHRPLYSRERMMPSHDGVVFADNHAGRKSPNLHQRRPPLGCK
jgi:hypothetical protein